MNDKIKVLKPTEKEIQEAEKQLSEEMEKELSNNEGADENGNTVTTN